MSACLFLVSTSLPNNTISMPGVEDLNGNMGVANSVLAFQLADGISPRMLSAETLAGAINLGVGRG